MAPLIIVSGPSGSGKSTLIQQALAERRFPLRLAVSATTRRRREGERDGVDYHFWSEERFLQALKDGELLEHAVVHGRYYGTPRAEVAGYREQGTGVILDIDVQGFANVRPLFPDCVSIFIALSKREMYEARIRRRGTETDEAVAERLRTAWAELDHQAEYQHTVYNDELAPAVRHFNDLIALAFAASRGPGK